MKLDKKSMALYAITDRTWLGEDTLEEQVEQALKGGATFLQLREKELGFDEFLDQAIKIKEVTDRYKVLFVINDNVKVAIGCDADGVHIGQGDSDAKKVRTLIGDGKIMGVSANTVEAAIKAEADGADYIGVGAVFKTSTKKDADVISVNNLREICDSVSIPVVAIGGIDEINALELKGSGIDGICCISAIFDKEDIYETTKNLYRIANTIVED